MPRPKTRYKDRPDNGLPALQPSWNTHAQGYSHTDSKPKGGIWSLLLGSRLSAWLRACFDKDAEREREDGSLLPWPTWACKGQKHAELHFWTILSWRSWRSRDYSRIWKSTPALFSSGVHTYCITIYIYVYACIRADRPAHMHSYSQLLVPVCTQVALWRSSCQGCFIEQKKWTNL